ncbi:FtsX-like permease family protein [Granulosicoccaceae sp. 1_MG-2023]|nr:FtsX-like permease family protein [Granulosicoccaceae sp. 1_MG-2023]
MNTTSLVRRSLKRDLRDSTLRILMAALIIAIAAVASVGFFTDRVSRALKMQAHELMAADLLLRSSSPVPDAVSAQAASLGLQMAETVNFPSVVLNGQDDSQLVSVKAVSEQYPLRGALSTQTADGATAEVSPAPVPGSVYVEPALMTFSGGAPLWVGELQLSVAREILSEPDRGQGFSELAPRVMMNLADLPQSGLITEGSRARYALLLAGEADALAAFRDWFEAQDLPQLSLRDVDNARPAMARVLRQISTYFGLAALVTVLLAGAAIAMSVGQFAQEQAIAGAVLRTLGARRRWVLRWLFQRLGLIALIALWPGVLLGLAVQALLTLVLGDLFALDLPPASFAPVAYAAAVTLLALAGFASLPVLRAGAVPVVAVLRQGGGRLDSRARNALLLALLTCVVLMFLQTGDWKLVLIMTLALFLVTAVFAIGGAAIYRLLGRLVPSRQTLLRLVLRRRTPLMLLQLSVFGLTLMAMLLIGVVRGDLMRAWEMTIPSDAPNRFLVNVRPDQQTGVQALLEQTLDFDGRLYPVTRARLVSVNGEPAAERYAGNADAEGFLRHDFNLSYSDSAPAHNTLIEGQWWSAPAAENLISVESGFAERLGLRSGDRLGFSIGSQLREGVVSNLREVSWESFQVNFYAITSRAMLEDLPAMYITGYRQGPQQPDITATLARQFPGVTVIDTGRIMQQAQQIMARGSLAVQSVFLFTLAAGIIVLLAAVRSSRAARIRELAVLRTMGASHRQVRASIWLEFTLMGATAGFLAAFFASLTAWLIARQLLEASYHPDPLVWVIGVTGGAVLVGISGYLANRGVLNRAPLAALRGDV